MFWLSVSLSQTQTISGRPLDHLPQIPVCIDLYNTDEEVTKHLGHSRFFPDGTVLSLLANEEVEPQSVIPSLLPSLRMKVSHILLFRLYEVFILYLGVVHWYLVPGRKIGHYSRPN